MRSFPVLDAFAPLWVQALVHAPFVPMPARQPSEDGYERKTCQRGKSIDDVIFQARVPARNEELQQLENTYQYNGNASGEHSLLWIGYCKGKPEQDEGKRMLTGMGDVGMRTESRRSQGREGDSCGKQPCEEPQNDHHRAVIARFDVRPPHACFIMSA